MNAKAIIPLVAGLGIGGIALKVGFDTLKSARGAQGSVATVQLWAAKQDIPRGTRISEEMLTTLSFPAQLAPKGACQDKAAVIDRVPKLDAPAGLPILADMLLPPGASAGVNPKPGFRAVAVKIDEGSGVDYHLEPGSWVDVVGSFMVRHDNRPQELVAKTIIENVEVAAVGPRIAPASGKEGEAKNEAPSRTVRAVTLYVRPAHVPTLLLAEQKGRIKLSLRGNQDAEEVRATVPTSETEITGENQQPQPPVVNASLLDEIKKIMAAQAPKPVAEVAVAAVAPPPAAQDWLVRIFRGDKREDYRFKSPDSSERVDAAPESGGSLFKTHSGTAPGTGASGKAAPPPAPAKPAANPQAAESTPAAAAAQTPEPDPAAEADQTQDETEREAEPEEPTE